MREGDAAVGGKVGHFVAGEGICDFGDEIVVCGIASLGGVEDAMAGAGAGWRGDRRAFAEGKSGGVDVEDADDVSAEIGDEEIFSGGVEADLVRMGGCLLRLRAGCAGEVEVLKGEELASGRVEDVGCYGPCVVGDNHQLGAVGAGVDDRVDGGERGEEVVIWLQGSRGVDFVGVERAVSSNDTFIEAVEVLALGVEL